MKTSNITARLDRAFVIARDLLRPRDHRVAWCREAADLARLEKRPDLEAQANSLAETLEACHAVE